MVGLLKTIPHKIGIFTGTNPHILKGLKTNYPVSFVEAFINSTPLRIYFLSSLVI